MPFSTDLIRRVQIYFEKNYKHTVSDQEAVEYLDRFADYFKLAISKQIRK
jgi:hypothetical protein